MMIYKPPLFALALAGMMTPAAAATDCASEWVLISQMTNADGSEATLIDDACQVLNISWADGTTADSLRWNVPGLAEAALQGMAPQAANVIITGIRENEVSADMGALAGKPGDIVLSYTWDATSRAMNISDLSVSFEGGQGIAVSGNVNGLDLSSPQMMQISAMSAALTDLDVQVKGTDMLALLAGIEDIAEGNPASAPTDEEIQEANAFVDQLPQAAFDAASRQALKDLVAALPEPEQGLRLILQSEVGLSAIRLMPVLMAGDAEPAQIMDILFDGATVDVTYPWAAE